MSHRPWTDWYRGARPHKVSMPTSAKGSRAGTPTTHLNSWAASPAVSGRALTKPGCSIGLSHCRVLVPTSFWNKVLWEAKLPSARSSIQQSDSVCPHRNWWWFKHGEAGPFESLLRSRAIDLSRSLSSSLWAVARLVVFNTTFKIAARPTMAQSHITSKVHQWRRAGQTWSDPDQIKHVGWLLMF